MLCLGPWLTSRRSSPSWRCRRPRGSGAAAPGVGRRPRGQRRQPRMLGTPVRKHQDDLTIRLRQSAGIVSFPRGACYNPALGDRTMASRPLSDEEIRRAISLLNIRIEEVEALARDDVRHVDIGVANVISNIRKTIRETFGTRSPEYRAHVNHEIWDGPFTSPMPETAKQRAFRAGIPRTVTMLGALVATLERGQVGDVKSSGRPFDD